MSYRSARRERYYESQWPEYVPVAERRRRAAVEMEKLRKKGQTVSPVTLAGKKIATTFWGKAWCDNLEGYADFANRIERGRTYVRNGSVVDLQIAPREVTAVVSGSSLYKIKIDIAEVPKPQWSTICRDCSGGIDSLVELLQGRFSNGVMERICRLGDGLFPKPAEIRFKCSCPDWAYMCKHIAAALYGVGARLDQQPELLFRLRAVDENELVARIDSSVPLAKGGPAAGKVLEDDDLSALFGLDMDSADAGAAETDGAKPTKAQGKKASARAKPPAPGKAVASTERSRTVSPAKPAAKRGATASATAKRGTTASPAGKRGIAAPVAAKRGTAAPATATRGTAASVLPAKRATGSAKRQSGSGTAKSTRGAPR